MRRRTQHSVTTEADVESAGLRDLGREWYRHSHGGQAKFKAKPKARKRKRVATASTPETAPANPTQLSVIVPADELEAFQQWRAERARASIQALVSVQASAPVPVSVPVLPLPEV